MTVATRAFILEPQWNPMAEEQALSRIHRMGQIKPVETVRYIMQGSIEEVSSPASCLIAKYVNVPEEHPRTSAAETEACSADDLRRSQA